MPLPNHPFRMFEFALPECELHLGGFRFILLNWGRVLPAVWNNISHKHSYYEACYSYQGEGVFLLNGRAHTVMKGQWCFSRPGEMHQMFSAAESNWGIYCLCFALLPCPGVAESANTGGELLDAFFQNRDRLADGEPMTPEICELMSKEVAVQQVGFEKSVGGIFSLLMVSFLRAIRARSGIGTKPFAHYGESAEIRVQKAVRYIEKNLDRMLTVQEVADSVFLSERQLTRIFRHTLSASPLQVMNQIRMNTAMQLLSGTILPIKEIAKHCGFANDRYFMSVFRKHTGMAAGTFRRKSRDALPSDIGQIRNNYA